jgi:hypothetical protein
MMMHDMRFQYFKFFLTNTNLVAVVEITKDAPYSLIQVVPWLLMKWQHQRERILEAFIRRWIGKIPFKIGNKWYDYAHRFQSSRVAGVVDGLCTIYVSKVVLLQILCRRSLSKKIEHSKVACRAWQGSRIRERSTSRVMDNKRPTQFVNDPMRVKK